MIEFNILRGEIERRTAEYRNADIVRRQEIIDEITRDNSCICNCDTVVIKTLDYVPDVLAFIADALKTDRAYMYGASDILKIPFYECEAIDGLTVDCEVINGFYDAVNHVSVDDILFFARATR